VFGTIFGGDSSISFKVALLNESKSEFATKFVGQLKDKDNEVIEVDEEITTIEAAREKMNRGEITATIILPKDFGEVKNNKYPSGEARVLYDQNNEQAGQTLGSVLEG